MKKVFALFLAIAMAGTLTACREVVPTNSNLTHTQVFDKMLENRIQYVGDNSGVDKLLSFLPVFDENFKQNGFELQTENEPYGLTIYYEPSEKWNGESDWIATHTVNIYAGFLFECIDNLEYIEFYRTIDVAENRTASSRIFRQGHLEPRNRIVFNDGRYTINGAVAYWSLTLDEELLNAWHWREDIKDYVGEEIYVTIAQTIPIDIVEDVEYREIPPAIMDEVVEYLFVFKDSELIYHRQLESPEEFMAIVALCNE